MKTRKFLIVSLIIIFLSGCVVISFYPLYTEKDLFPNDILTGSWMDEDSTEWIFEHSAKKEKGIEIIDSTSYKLKFRSKENTEFKVVVIKLDENYFLDFYLEDYFEENMADLEIFHLMPVHTFAKLTVSEDTLNINWYNSNWLQNLINENRIRIHHENNGEFILLTAKPEELRKFVTKYVNSEEAFKDGMDAVLVRK